MNPKGFPKRLDSKTTCLRITVPENLDLALEGLIRKVLREQPKTDDIYAFAANYFDTLLKIRDKAGVKYTANPLCPIHNDEEAREMIVLAGTFPRRVSGRAQGKEPVPLKTKTKNETDKAETEKGLRGPKEKLKDSKQKAEKKQTTPDLIKKLPLLAQNQGLNREEAGGEKARDVGPDRDRTESDAVKDGDDDEEYLTSDPIKEFVEKELLTEENSKEKKTKGKAPEDSEAPEKGSPSPTAGEGQREGAEGRAPLASNTEEKKGAVAEDNPGTAEISDEVIRASEDGGKREIDSRTREADEKGLEAGDVAKDAEDKIGDAVQPEEKGERTLQETLPKKEKGNEEKTTKLRDQEESRNKVESASETETEGIEAPLPPLPPPPDAMEKHEQEPVHDVSPSYNATAEVPPGLEGGKVMQSGTLEEITSPQEKGIAGIEGRQQPTEDKSETDAQPSTPPPIKNNEESQKTSSLVIESYDSKPTKNDGAHASETDKSHKTEMTQVRSNETESIARGKWEDEDRAREVDSGGTERRISSSETSSSPERAKGVLEARVHGVSFEEDSIHRTKDGDPNKERKNRYTKAEDPSKPHNKSTEEGGKLTSESAVEVEDDVEEPERNPGNIEDSTAQLGEGKGTESPGKLDPHEAAGDSEILKEDQELSHSNVTVSDEEAEPQSVDAEGKAGENKKAPDDEIKAEDRNLVERLESSVNHTTAEEELRLQKEEEVHSAPKARTKQATGDEGGQTLVTGIPSATQGPGEDQGDAKEESPRDRETRDPGRLPEDRETQEIATRETESARPQEFKAESAPATEHESLPDEELCSVVDINHVKREAAVDEGDQEEHKLAEPRPENTAEEKSAPEPEGSSSQSLSPSAPSGENPNDKPSVQSISEAKDAQATERKAESQEPPKATAAEEPEKSEIDKERGTSEEGSPRKAENWEAFGPSAEGKQIIIVEEPETTNENPEESAPPGEIQIKTIQTHYYDALRVPETVTREYRVHEVAAATIGGFLGTASPPHHTLDEVQGPPGIEERSERLLDDGGAPPTPTTTPTSDGDLSLHFAQPSTGPALYPSDVKADALLDVDGVDRDTQVSDSDDLLHLTTPTSDVTSNISELSLQAASEAFLTNEKRFSSLEKEEIRFITPTRDEARKGEPEVVARSREVKGVDETGRIVSSGTPEKSETVQTSTGRAEGVEESGERLTGSSGASPTSGNGKTVDGDSLNVSGSERPVSETRPQGEDESVQDAAGQPSGVTLEDTTGGQDQAAPGVENGEKEPSPLLQKAQRRTALKTCPEEVQSESDGRRDTHSTEPTPTQDASSADTDSTASNATTEVKRADSARSLSSVRSLDFGKRNPLVRTRSLSSNRHGVADFEVWNTIEKELEEAATKIQSKFRGYKTRKKLRREVAVQISTEESSTRSTPVELDDSDDRSRATGEFHDGIVLSEHPR